MACCSVVQMTYYVYMDGVASTVDIPLNTVGYTYGGHLYTIDCAVLSVQGATTGAPGVTITGSSVSGSVYTVTFSGVPSAGVYYVSTFFQLN